MKKNFSEIERSLDVRMIHIRVPMEAHKHLKIAAASLGESMQKYVMRLIKRDFEDNY